MGMLKLKPLRKIKKEIIPPPKIGEIVEGCIVATARQSVFVDLGAQGIGVIFGREFLKAKDFLKNKKIGDKILAKVIALEDENGYRELSVVEASKEYAWKELKEKREKGEILEVTIQKANKGGLVCEVKGIQGFVPVSQLSAEKYPKVENGEGAKIAKALQKFIGKKFKLKIIDLDQKKEKLILSEKAALAKDKEKEKEKTIQKFKVGEVVEGKVTGVTNFGGFVEIAKGVEALLRASDLPIKKGEKPSKVLKVGEKIKGKIIEIKDGQIYLSLK